MHLRGKRRYRGSKGVRFSGLKCLSWSKFGSTLGLFAQVRFKRVLQGKNGALLQPFTLWSPKHAHAAVLDCADNALLCARPSQQLLYLFRHTRLHRTDEWVKIGGRHILIPIISVWFGWCDRDNRVRVVPLVFTCFLSLLVSSVDLH